MVRAEKRKMQRKSLQRRVWIDLANGAPAIECALGNMSDSGAKLIFSNEVGELPNQFVLLLAQDGRVARQCRLAWKYGEEVGVEFTARRIGPALRSSRAAAER
jgi:hypothetical protein